MFLYRPQGTQFVFEIQVVKLLDDCTEVELSRVVETPHQEDLQPIQHIVVSVATIYLTQRRRTRLQFYQVVESLLKEET